MKASIHVLAGILTLIWALNGNVWSANVYVDKTIGTDITNRTYSISNRNDSGNDGNCYKTIQSAINACAVGDTIYMRGGTYQEIDIDIPESKNGTAWTAGNFTTLKSYGNEWAKVDGTGLDPVGSKHIFRHPTSYGVGQPTDYTKFWKFERFEVTGGRNGFWLKGGPMWFRYMYVHGNGRNSGDTLMAGIMINMARDCIIEYCYIADNINPVVPDLNNGNIMFDADYKDSSANGGLGAAFTEDACIKGNIIRYNLIKGSKIGVRHKNQQRFGYNDRNPTDLTYKVWGDRIHNNIILGADKSIDVGQDFCQIYNNIVDATIEASQNGDVPIVYNNVLYNNTSISTRPSFLTNSGLTTSGNLTMVNFYDSGGQQTVHPHIWYYNNISHGNGSGWHEIPFIIAWDMPANTNNPSWDMTNLVLERNFIHEAAQNNTFLVGHNYSSGFSGCKLQDMTTVKFNACSATWRGVGTVLNWENDNAGLFQATSGAGMYKARGSFSLDGGYTISNGGISGNHPYLAGISLPSYIGATNPNKDSGSNWNPITPDPEDSGWVDYVLKVVGGLGAGALAPASPKNLKIITTPN